jgi:hypothetical protein
VEDQDDHPPKSPVASENLTFRARNANCERQNFGRESVCVRKRSPPPRDISTLGYVYEHLYVRLPSSTVAILLSLLVVVRRNNGM